MRNTTTGVPVSQFIHQPGSNCRQHVVCRTSSFLQNHQLVKCYLVVSHHMKAYNKSLITFVFDPLVRYKTYTFMCQQHLPHSVCGLALLTSFNNIAHTLPPPWIKQKRFSKKASHSSLKCDHGSKLNHKTFLYYKEYGKIVQKPCFRY